MSKKNDLDLARDEMTIADAARFLGHETSSALSHLKARGRLHPRRYVGRFPIYDVRTLDEYAGNWNDVRVNPNEAAEMCGVEHYQIRHAARGGKILYCYQIGSRWQISVNGLRRAGLLDPAAAPVPADEPEQTSLDVEKDEETIETLRRRLDAAERERDLAVREMRLMEDAESERLRTLVEEGDGDLAAAIHGRMKAEEALEQERELGEVTRRNLAIRTDELNRTRRILREISQPGGGRLRDLVNLLDALDSLDAIDDADAADERPVVLPGGEY